MTPRGGEAAILEAQLRFHEAGGGRTWSPLDLGSYLPLPLCVTSGKPLGLSEPSIPVKEIRSPPFRLAKGHEVPGTEALLGESCWDRSRLYLFPSPAERGRPRVTRTCVSTCAVMQWPSHETKGSGAAAGRPGVGAGQGSLWFPLGKELLPSPARLCLHTGPLDE